MRPVWQRFDVGRKQLAQAAVFENQSDDRVAVGEHLQVLLVGAILFGFGLARVRVDLQPGEQRLAQLFGRVDIQRRIAAQFPDAFFESDKLSGELAARGRQRFGVDLYAGHLDIGQHADQRFLDRPVQFFESGLLQLRP